MGAEFQTYEVTAKDKKELKKKYNALVKEALYDHGHSGYTGSIAESAGLTIVEEELSEEEAETYIDENAKKWENTLAVKIKDKEDQWLIGGVYSS